VLFPNGIIKLADNMQNYTIDSEGRIVSGAMCGSVTRISTTPFFVWRIWATSSMYMPFPAMNTPKMKMDFLIIVCFYYRNNLSIMIF